jgi:hypothetical protein
LRTGDGEGEGREEGVGRQGGREKEGRQGEGRGWIREGEKDPGGKKKGKEHKPETVRS